MKLFLIGGMEDLNFNYCYKITYESGETYDRRRNELSVEISKEDYKKIITGVLQERPIEQIEGISDVIDKMTENVEFADRFMNKNGSCIFHLSSASFPEIQSTQIRYFRAGISAL